MNESDRFAGRSFQDATLGTRIAVWKWGMVTKTGPWGLFPLSIHFENPNDQATGGDH